MPTKPSALKYLSVVKSALLHSVQRIRGNYQLCPYKGQKKVQADSVSKAMRGCMPQNRQ